MDAWAVSVLRLLWIKPYEILIQVFVVLFSFLLGEYLGVGWLSHVECVCFVSWDLAPLFLTGDVCSWSCSSSLRLYDVVTLFSYSHSGGCRVGELVKNCLQRGFLNQELKLRKQANFLQVWQRVRNPVWREQWVKRSMVPKSSKERGMPVLLDLVSSFKNFGSFSEWGWGIIGIFWWKYGMAWLTYF